jgi:hypothetical protein
MLFGYVINLGVVNVNIATKKLITSSLLVFTLVGVILSTPRSVSNPTELLASQLSFTVNATRFPNLTSTKTTSEIKGSVVVSGVEVELGLKNMGLSSATVDGINNTPTLSTTRNASAIYNITALPGKITSLRIRQTTGQTNTLHLGDSSRIIDSTTAVYAPITGTSDGSNTVSSNDQLFTSTDIPIINTLNLNFFALLPTGNTDIIELTFNMEVATVVVQNAETFNFAADFLAVTLNKQALCTDEDLSWSFSSIDPINPESSETANPQTLQGKFSKLNDNQKIAFQTDTTDSQIVAARQRYIYLRSYNPSLFNFAGI